jgi:hypothetical protein
MPVNGTTPDPHTSSTPAEFVALLRQLREQSGLAYRAIERRAASAGDTLPPSTLATMLNRTTLPREELVVALLRAVGQDEQTIDQWVRARRALISAAPVAVPPEPEGKKPVQPKILAGVIAGLVVIVGLVIGLQKIRKPLPRPVLLAGPMLIRNINSGFCLSEKQGSESGDLFQVDCAKTYVPRALVPRDGGKYQITTMHPEFGAGCMGAAHAVVVQGNAVVDDYCQFLANTAELELIAAGAGYQIKVVDLCAEVIGSSQLEWAAVHLLPCDPLSKGQIFTFEPVKPDAGVNPAGRGPTPGFSLAGA